MTLKQILIHIIISMWGAAMLISFFVKGDKRG